VEGGAKLINLLIEAQLFDEIRVLKSKNTIGSGIRAPMLPKHIILTEWANLEGDELKTYK
jgi:riboflavin biosynthesis pyrimidine reductase